MSIRIYGNREIKTLPGLETRPTPAKVRQAVFNIWQGTIDNCRWLDLCSGSGAMGAEALCRGAKLAIGIEKSSAASTIVAQNWCKVAQLEQSIRVLRRERFGRISGSTIRSNLFRSALCWRIVSTRIRNNRSVRIART
jgi:16S rRNA (guanine966-N2)-methyltransferase